MNPARQALVFLFVAVPLLSPRNLCAQSASPAVTAATEVPAPIPVRTPVANSVLPTTGDLLQKYQTATGGQDVWSSFQTRFM